jgi:ABC-type dipeptide/oligopeptide/nickel transport system permease subunit
MSASQWAVAWRRFKKNRVALIGLFIIGAYAFLAIFAPFLARYPPASVQPIFEGEAGLPPSWKYPYGTTSEGRDVFSDTLHATGNMFYVGLGATGISAAIAVVVGLPAGYFGRKIDDALMRVAEVFLVFPILLIILVLARVLVLAVGAGLGLTIIVFILGIFGWGGLARLIRGEVLRVRELEFVQAAKCLGASSRRILFRHLFPNVLSAIIVYSTLLIATNILTEAVISFLGFGDPNTVTYGQLLNIGFVNFVREWWTEVLVGITLLIAVVGFNLIGDGLSDALNPRLRE